MTSKIGQRLRGVALAAGLVLTSASLLAAGPAAAQQKPLSVAVVDVQKVMEETSAAKSLQEQLGKVRAGFRDGIAKDEEALRKEQEDLQKQRSLLSPEAFQKRREEFERKYGEMQKAVAERRRSFDETSARAQMAIDQAFLQVLANLAEERGYTLVLPRQTTILVDNSLDVTDEVIQRMNKSVPKLDLPKAQAPKK
ncbi:OmpH family outer membrane protein [Tistrella mobilis]|uniref:OmpH family outer membrane protein n=1 Tax=Tistrella mobilis TaxID=171437 RepID=UPI003555DE27